ncbi:hypothetical protein VKT23_008605 [Stygiomarasmius scandens]|uniref:Retrotransposon gag domain-containing protein n=1 Tax=Marasmiellus scandens TaxID=2682957 RepID=A0ABR1JK66_9AGAR
MPDNVVRYNLFNMDIFFILLLLVIFLVTVQAIGVVYYYFGGITTVLLLDTLLIIGMSVVVFWRGGRRFGTPHGTTDPVRRLDGENRPPTPDGNEHIRSEQGQGSGWREPPPGSPSNPEQNTDPGEGGGEEEEEENDSDEFSPPSNPSGHTSLQNLLDALHLRAEPQQEAEGSGTQTERPKGKVTYAKEPPEFDGKKTEYKDFKRRAKNYAKAYASSFNTKEEYNRWLTSYFTKGDAAKYAEIIEENGWLETLTTDGIWEKLDARFHDGKTPRKAAEQLEVTRQGRTEIQEFMAWFEEKLREAGYTWFEKKDDGTFEGEDANIIRLMDKALKQEIVRTIHTAQDVPVNYIPYREKALRIGINLENYEEIRKGGSQVQYIDGKTAKGSSDKTAPAKATTGGPGVPATAYSAGTSQGTPMQIDRTMARTKGLCYKCGQKWGEGKDCDQCKRKGIQVRSTMEESNKPVLSPVEDKGKAKDPAEGPGFQKGAQ